MHEANLDHKQLLAALPDEVRSRLTEKSDWPGLLHLAVHVGALVILAIWVALAMPAWQLAMVLLGVLLVFLFTLLHETVHFTPFKTPWLNVLVGVLCGFLIFIPPLWFRYFHLAHHRHTHDPNNDPELESAKPETLASYLWHLTGFTIWFSQAKVLLFNALGKTDYPYLPPAATERVKLEARLMLTFYAVLWGAGLYLGWTWLLWLWLGPLVLGQPFLRLYLMAEHGRCPHVTNMLENTRTTITTALVRRLAWNMPYHIEHHTYPSIPFHKLPEFHRYTRDYIKVQATGYSGFHRETIQEFQK